MDIRVNNLEQTVQPEAAKQVQETGGDAFKFMLMSNIEESELQEKQPAAWMNTRKNEISKKTIY